MQETDFKHFIKGLKDNTDCHIGYCYASQQDVRLRLKTANGLYRHYSEDIE